jgi:fatty acid desaturase
MERPSTRDVLQALRDADAALVRRHAWLGRDDAVAVVLWLGALGLAAGAATLWWVGPLPGVAAVPLIAFALSTLHELEHDLIHTLYFERPWLRTLVLATIWVGKASLDPWSRGRLHRWHHAVSGQPEDIEERLIGLGLRWGPLRVLLSLLPAFSMVLVPSIRRAVLRLRKEGGRVPDLRAPRWFALVKLVNNAFTLLPFVAAGGWLAGAAWATPLLVLWVLPNTLRHLAIVVMSSNSHYTGIARGRLVEQNQVLDHPLFLPLQLFCWNFGATHVVHHFLVQQPFWRRTLVMGQVRDVLLAHGVRRNDLGTFARANRRDG